MKTISFREDMIDLILAGKKTLTIRPIKPQPVLFDCPGLFGSIHYEWGGGVLAGNRNWLLQQCPYGAEGDVVGVEESENLRLKITSVYAKRLDQVAAWQWSEDGLGYGKTVYKHWQSFYRGTEYEWKNRPFVWVIRFEVIE